MKTKGFTLIELVVACTLLVMLSMIASTTTFNFLQATIKLKAQDDARKNIEALHIAVANAKMNYAIDLAFQLAALTNQLAYATDPATITALQGKISNVNAVISNWNLWAQQNDSPGLINQLINPTNPNPADFPIFPIAPLNPPPSSSYLPASLPVQVTTYDIQGASHNNCRCCTNHRYKILTPSYQLTDDGTPTGNPVATISVGPMLEVTSSGTVIRPMLPIID